MKMRTLKVPINRNTHSIIPGDDVARAQLSLNVIAFLIIQAQLLFWFYFSLFREHYIHKFRMYFSHGMGKESLNIQDTYAGRADLRGKFLICGRLVLTESPLSFCSDWNKINNFDVCAFSQIKFAEGYGGMGWVGFSGTGMFS